MDRPHRRFEPDERVATPFGTGTVVRYRPNDDVYEIKMDFGGMLFRNGAEAETTDRALLTLSASTTFPTPARTTWDTDAKPSQRRTRRRRRRPTPRAAQRMGLYATWFALMLAGWLLSKAWCAAGIPGDCSTNGDFTSAGVIGDVLALLIFSTVLAWFTNLSKPSRFWKLFSARRWYFFVLYIVVAPAWSALGNIPGFSLSLSGGGFSNASVAVLALLTVLAIVALLIVVWHVVYAWRHFPRAEFTAYTVSRVLVVAYFVVLVVSVSVSSSSPCSVHLHHYLMAFAAGTFCIFDHWISIVSLALTTGVMVQGLAAYDYAALFSAKSMCLHFMDDNSTAYTASPLYYSASRQVYPNGATVAPFAPYTIKYCIVDSAGNPLPQTAFPRALQCNGQPWPTS